MMLPTAGSLTRRIALVATFAPALLGAQRATDRVGTPASAITPGAPGDPSRGAARATATSATARRASQAPLLDGRDDDAAWRDAQLIDQFLEYDPTPGAETRFKTQARVLYDDKALYVLVRMYDPAPDSIVSLLSRRDVRTNSEQVKIVIDSYHDRRTGYEFCVNPAGVKRDYYVYNDDNEDGTWDAVWDVATKVDSSGWVAEFRIPFSQLRFPNAPERSFGLMIVRDVARTNARISWPLFHRDRQGYISQLGELGGLLALPSPRRLEVVPYAVTQNVTQARTGNLSGFKHPQQASFGADVKYGLTSNLTLDATVNPDFGQVEADPAVLNLSAFEQFFEERRPFFLEGAGIFNFRTSCNDIDTGCRGLFYSRRIGRSPQLAGYFGDASSPTFTTIQAASKLTGRLSNGLSLGVLDALTQEENGPKGIIEPRSNYFVARALQDLNKGQSGIGAMVTAVNRDLNDLASPYLRRSAYTGGIDFRHRFFKKNYELTAMLSGSTVAGSEQAIATLQRDGVHRYQRPDGNLPYDSTRTSLGGAAQRVSMSKFGGGHTRFQSVYQRYSPGFESNDLGFQSRADEQMFRNWFALTYQTPSKRFRSRQFNFNTFQSWTTAGLPTSVGVNTNFHLQLKNTNWAHFGVNYNDFVGATYDDRAARGGPAVRKSASANGWLGWDGDYRRTLTPNAFAGWNVGDVGKSYGWWINPGVNLRLASQFSTNLGVDVEQYRNDAQWLGNFGAIGADTTHYTFARLDQTIVSMTARMNFTATPTLSMQVYLAPYVNTGTYANWKQLRDARAAKYDDRFAPYAGDPGGFDYQQLRSNTVVRWEYRPGSALFVVWQHGRELYRPGATDFNFGREAGDLLGIHPNNTFLVKLSYWLNP
jgi:hypothetical protein